MQYEAINRWLIEQYAYLLQRMDSIQEGEGTLLDHSMVLMGSGLKDGNKHTCHDMAIVLGGGGSGTIRPGRAIDYPMDTPLNRLYISIAHSMGVPLASFGDATQPLDRLT